VGLELATFDVNNVVLGTETKFADRVVSIDKGEFRRKLLEGEELFRDVDVDVVSPGDEVRIVHVIDVVEPRVRVSEPGTDFPGLLGKPRTVGSGRTHRLNGVEVTAVGEPVPGEPTYWREAIFDMGGEGAKFSPFSHQINVVLTFYPNLARFPEVDPDLPDNVFGGTTAAAEYNRAIRIAELKAAVYLAETTRGLKPDRVVDYELDRDGSGRPGVVYLFQMSWAYVYGVRENAGGITGGAASLPTVIHPNEILDGALVNSVSLPSSFRDCTYTLQNHPVIEELYAHQGNDLTFKGVVLFTNGDNVESKERMSSYAANLASLLGAQGAVLSYSGGGHPIIDVMLACQKLEQRGIKTTLLLDEMAANPEDSGHVYYVSEADAIVSTGNYEQVVDLPPLPRVLGGSDILEGGGSAAGPLHLTLRQVLSSTDPYGLGTLRAREH
jgi:glycine reductase